MSHNLEKLTKIGKRLTSLLKTPSATFQVNGQSIKIMDNDKSLVFDASLRHSSKEFGDEFVLVADEVENLFYTQLSVVVEVKGDDVVFVDYPPYRELKSHFEK